MFHKLMNGGLKLYSQKELIPTCFSGCEGRLCYDLAGPGPGQGGWASAAPPATAPSGSGWEAAAKKIHESGRQGYIY